VARIKDVAQEANVSIATVSRVINNIPLVNEETRQRVLAAIKKTGYKPNIVARSLKLQKSNTIGVIINDITRPVMTACLAGIQEELSANGYSTMVSYTQGRKNAEAEALDMFFLRQCDGIILIGTNLDDDTVETIKQHDLPAVSCLVIPDDGRLPSVGFDEYEASKLAVKHLIRKGHRKIGAFMGNDSYHMIPKRIQGFFDAINEEGIEILGEWVIRDSMTFRGGYNCAKQLTTLPPEDLPTAVYCFNDDMAIGAIKAFYQESGIVVPDDISVISLNGSVYADWSLVSVTNVRFDSHETGIQGAKMLLEMCATGEKTEMTTYIPLTIKEGASVKDIN